mmetsp:Transcript_2432/g.3000  ORF Transcript_2432/g.3000 Transcript_2432/m.3000 type:complete len:177 (-) Transcript_2432:825-1355(-)
MKDSEFANQVIQSLKNSIEKIKVSDDQDDVVLTMEAQDILINEVGDKDEHFLIFHLTPILTELCGKCHLLFVNSEEYKWVHTLLGEKKTHLKPDALSSPAGMYEDLRPPKASEELGALRNEKNNLLFGKGIWKIRDFYVVWEFKKNIDQTAQGQAFSYAVHLSRRTNSTHYVILKI